MTSIEPYQIAVSDSKIDHLRKKLEASVFPDELEDAGWDYGAPLADVQRLATYWQETFDWRKEEAKLNQLPNFTTTIQAQGFESLHIHFLHQKSNVSGAIPLLFCHGWVCPFATDTLSYILVQRRSCSQPVLSLEPFRFLC